MNRAEVYVDYFKTFYKLADQRCRDYWGTDRPNGQAAGLESLCAFAGMVVSPCYLRHPTRSGHVRSFTPDAEELVVVDAGAGASSAILRTYFKNVVSCDPDVDYLNQVRRACEAMGLGHGGWAAEVPQGEWDACFYDYGTKERVPMFPEFMDRTRRVIWIDDAHDAQLLAACGALAASRDLTLRVAPATIDEHGRFGAFVVKEGPTK